MKKMILWALCSILFAACNDTKPPEAKMDDKPAVTAEPKMAPAEFADAKYAEMAGKSIAALSAGDVDGFVAGYADNAVYMFNNGDSLAGKAAITEYWKKRRNEKNKRTAPLDCKQGSRFRHAFRADSSIYR